MTTVQYDHIFRRFGISDKDEPFPDSTTVVAKLNNALDDVKTWLDLKRRTGRYSHAFLIELAMGSATRKLHVHMVYDEIGKLEESDTVPSIAKKAKRMRAPLADLWHKHYFQPGYIPRNLLLDAERMQKDGRWEALFAPHYGKYMEECSAEILDQLVRGGYERRAKDQRITGEFIVFERLPDGSNYYLTLGKHGKWNEIRARVDQYKRFDAQTLVDTEQAETTS